MTNRTIGTEVRIHGIGNHPVYSALGSPRRSDGRFLDPKDKEPAVVRPATDREPHDVWLLAWTRWSRSINSVTWYLGLPFTLCNTAGAMGSPRTGGKVTRAAAIVIGLLLTVGAFFWSVNAVETAMWKLRLPSHLLGIPLPSLAFLTITGIWSVLLLRRAFGPWFTAPEQSPLGRHLAAAHLGVLWVSAIAVMIVKPARSRGSCLGEESPSCLAWWSDWTIVLGWMTILLSVALALAIAVGALGRSSRTWADVSSAPSLGAAITLLAASVLLHAAGSVTTLLVDWICTYLQGIPPVRGRIAEAVPLLRAYDYKNLLFSGRDTLAAVWVPIGWLLVLVLLLRFVWTRLRKRVVGPATLRAAAQRTAARHHQVITEPGARRFAITFLMVLTVLIALATAMLIGLGQVQEIVARGKAPSTGLQILWRTTVVGMHALVVLLPFSLLSGDVRAAIAVGSDVVGYWPIAHHPLAAPPYRFETLRAAVAEVQELPRPLVIVGHSQGSVLAFGLIDELAQRGWPREDLGLVTCGSPLSSLYSAYFPTHFPIEARTRVGSSVRQWNNFWRETDPIATPMSRSDVESTTTGSTVARPVDDVIPDGDSRSGEPILRVHGDYWLEPEQIAAVRAAVTGGVGPS